MGGNILKMYLRRKKNAYSYYASFQLETLVKMLSPPHSLMCHNQANVNGEMGTREKKVD